MSGTGSDSVLPQKCKKRIAKTMKDLPFPKTGWKYSELPRKVQDWFITDRFWTKVFAPEKIGVHKEFQECSQFYGAV